MSSVWASELYQIEREIVAMAGPWPSDTAVRRAFVLRMAARDLIAHDRPKIKRSLAIRSATAYRKKPRRSTAITSANGGTAA